MQPCVNRYTHRLLRSLLASCWLFSPVLVADATTRQPSALSAALNDARLASWQTLLDNSAHDDERAQLERVNHFINRSVSFVSDQQAWGADDYWATPAQTLSLGKGDCEDFAIAKYFSLVRMGIPSEKLRLTFVKALKQNQAHMVLAYYPSASEQPLILDNLDPRIRPASERNDLLPVYSFNSHGVFLAKSPQRASQPPEFLARWNELSERALADGSATPSPQS
ncbi:MAG: transglutaminase-like cysteine peptidase [Gammaproteobacteria bacterium]|nr:transglutaminase-like cysteine peptidase [Gammaproteobacteria bacterium]MBU0882580.1 transglutaminase-like cysteine peptidase [Gammaproteobacteria bacterium]MBU1860787.1 transglutaminase-like cysteine peptidase [Gammaproteobacteria bacterium]